MISKNNGPITYFKKVLEIGSGLIYFISLLCNNYFKGLGLHK